MADVVEAIEREFAAFAGTGGVAAKNLGTGEEIQPGEDVRATYQVIDGQPTAVKIDVTSNKSRTSPSSSSDTSQPKQK